jgi:hypothetical protein
MNTATTDPEQFDENEEQFKHQKITEYTKDGDGIEINSKSYYEKLALHVREHETQVFSSYFTLKKDVEQALCHFTDDGATKLVLTIENKKPGIRITKRWVEFKKDYPRK